MTSIASQEFIQGPLAGAGTGLLFDPDAEPHPSGSVPRIVNRISYSILRPLDSAATNWIDPLAAHEIGVLTGASILESYEEPMQGPWDFLVDWSGFLDLHNKLLPVVYELKPTESRRVTDILFSKKLVRRLD